MHYPLLLVCMFALTTACKGAGDDASSSDTATSEADTEPTTTAGGPPCPDDAYSCCCFEQTEGTVIGRCLLGAVCSTVLASCSDPALGSCAPGESDAEAVDCILEALLAGTPGENRWRASYGEGSEFSDETVVLYTAGDGTVVWLGARYEGVDEILQGAYRYSIAALDLESCTALPSVAKRYACLRAAFEAPTIETCIEPEA